MAIASLFLFNATNVPMQNVNIIPSAFRTSAFRPYVRDQDGLTAMSGADVALIPDSDAFCVVGGHDDKRYTRTVAAYDVKKKAMAIMCTLPSSRTLTSATFLDGRLYVIGGICGLTGTICKNGFVFDFQKSSWDEVGCLNVPRAAAQLLVVNRKLFIFGGFSDAGNSLSSCEWFDVETNEWTLCAAEMNLARSFAAAALIDESTVLIVGGYNDVHRKSLKSIELYNVDVDAFTIHEPTLALPRAGLSLAIQSGDVYAVGGLNATPDLNLTNCYRQSEELRMHEQKWKWRPCSRINLKYPRDGSKCILVGDVLCVVGGRNEKGYVKVIETFQLKRRAVASESFQIGACRRLSSLLSDQSTGDVTISCDDGCLHAHECILRTLPFFDAILRPGFQEGNEKNITVPYDCTTVKIFLHLIYTGHFSSAQQNATSTDLLNLLHITHFFGCTDVLHGVTLMLQEAISHENVIDIYKAATQLDLPQLKEACLSRLVSSFEAPSIHKRIHSLPVVDLQFIHERIAKSIAASRCRKRKKARPDELHAPLHWI